MMRGNKQPIATLSIIATGALLCAPFSALASMADAAVTEQVMHASGGLTLGSAALIAIAGVVVTFGKSRVDPSDASQQTALTFGKQRPVAPSRLSGEQQQ